MDLSVLAATFAVVFVAELGDKTQITAMVLATQHPWKKVFAGLALAFVLLNAGAVLIGKLLFVLLPLLWIKVASAVLFAVFGVLTLCGKDDDDDEAASERSSRRGPVWTAFLLILAAELGDKTQIMTASLAAQHASQVAVFLGSTLALWIVSLIGILVGRQIVRYIPMRIIKRVAGAVFLAFAAAFVVQAIRA